MPALVAKPRRRPRGNGAIAGGQIDSAPPQALVWRVTGARAREGYLRRLLRRLCDNVAAFEQLSCSGEGP